MQNFSRPFFERKSFSLADKNFHWVAKKNGSQYLIRSTLNRRYSTRAFSGENRSGKKISGKHSSDFELGNFFFAASQLISTK